MSPKRSFTLEFLGDDKSAGRAFKNIAQNADNSGKRISGAFKRAALAIGAAFAGVQVGQFLKGSISAASDLNESMSKVNVVFGDSSKSVKKFAESAASSMGISQQAALEAAGTFGNLFTALKIGSKPAADMSTKLVKLAGDFASFNNVSPEEALTALRAGLVGETEPLKRFGVNMNEATLRAQALKMGLISNTKDALDPATKAQAAYALIMEQSTNAQGDFARTSDGLANKQRIMAAQFQDLKAKIGTALLPVILKLAGGLSGILKLFSDFANGDIASAGVAIGKFFGWEEDSAATDRVIRSLEALRDIVKNLFSLNLAGLGVAIGKLFGHEEDSKETGKFISTLGKLRNMIVTVVGAIRTNWPQIRAVISNVMTTVGAVISGAVTVIMALWNNFGNNILSFVQRVWPNVRQVISGVLEAIRAIVKIVTSIIQGDWSAAWNGVKALVHGVFNAIFGLIKIVMEQIRAVIGVILEVIGSIFKGAVRGILGFLSRNWPTLLAILTGPIGIAVLVINRNWDRIKSGVSSLFNSVRDWFGRIVSFIGGLPGKISRAASGMWDGIKNAFRSAVNWIIRGWNRIQFKIPGFDPPGPGPKFGGFTLGLPNISPLADGGIVKARPGGILANIGEGGRDEAVIPLNRAGGIGSTTINVYVEGSVVSERQLIDAVHKGFLEKQKRNGSLQLA